MTTYERWKPAVRHSASLLANTMIAQLRKALAWLEAHSRWSQLRVLGESNFVKASVLMPAFGYLLLLNDNVHQYLTIRLDGWILNHLPTTWRIWLLFYGSFLLAMGSVLFSCFCPAEVKRYASSFEMADAECQHQYNLGQFPMVRDLLKSLYDGLSAWERLIVPTAQTWFFSAQPQSALHPQEMLSILLINQWTIKNMKRPRLRLLLMALFAVGLLLLAIPAVITFLQVTFILLKRSI